MMKTSGRVQRLAMPILAATLLLGLQGCVSFGGKVPVSMLTLAADENVVAGASKTGTANEALVIRVPEVPRKLDTNRIPVSIDSANVAYLKDSVWADKPAMLMQQLLSETLSARNNLLVLNESEISGRAGSYLSGQLVEFGIDASRMEAVAVFDAVKLRKGQPIEKRRFQASEPVGKIDPEQAGRGLNIAANKVAAAVAEWMAQ